MSMKRVLSIQSHVVHGYVGNKAAVFPLQLLGFDVDILPSVVFSNHAGYHSFPGIKMDKAFLASITQGLSANGLLDGYHWILTGFLGTMDFGEGVLRFIEEVKRVKQHSLTETRYLCDPVLGDAGSLYVPSPLISLYKDHLIPLADTITPNDFETFLLTGVEVKSLPDAVTAVKKLHDLGPTMVVISSCVLQEFESRLCLIGSTRTTSQSESTDDIFVIPFPKLPFAFSGTGDLFASILLSQIHHTNDLKSACEVSVSKIYRVLCETIASHKNLKNQGHHEHNNAGECNVEQDNHNEAVKQHITYIKELRIIQSKHHLENDVVLFSAQRVDATSFNVHKAVE